MGRYRIFIAAFFTGIVSLIAVMAIYCSGIIGLITRAQEQPGADPAHFFATLFTPQFFIALCVLIVSSLTYRILGIIFIAGNRSMAEGEKVMWIVGFVLLSFITGIVFMALAKSRNLTGPQPPASMPYGPSLPQGPGPGL